MTAQSEIERATHRLDRAGKVVGTVLDHLTEQRVYVSTLKAATYDGTGGSSSTVPDPTAAAAAELDRIQRHRDYVYGMIACVHTAIDALDEAMRDALGTRASLMRDGVDKNPAPNVDAPRCIGWTGSDGHHPCEQIPTSRRNVWTASTVDDGRCVDCGPKQDAMDKQKRDKAQAQRQRYHARGAA